ncbi:hypothetical protein [Vibrio diabolicus]|uniref:hypothetical protein n=1 Tax=Vibrio diabolicus TaxID=50719 RepID=UPI00215F9803|nr:hypothetical protein [Vibrio diabolicus]MCS0376586.1 hypothetical protein [Vibrio diabolicus]
MSQEIDYLLRVDIDGVKVTDEKHAIVARVSEWLDTPEGQVWGAPKWGNRLGVYKHEPINETTAAAIENSILLTLPIDVKDAVVQGIAVEPSVNGIDAYKLTIVVNGQTLERGITF